MKFLVGESPDFDVEPQLIAEVEADSPRDAAIRNALDQGINYSCSVWVKSVEMGKPREIRLAWIPGRFEVKP